MSARRSRGTTRSVPAYVLVPVFGLGGTLVYGYFHFLDEAPFTKRKRLIATNPAWERQMGDSEYESLVKQFRKDILPPNHRATVTVKRVGSRIAEAADSFAKKHLPPEDWKGASPYTYTVVRSDMANAFVLPNNHVFVLTGLFKYARNEDELAAVLGHEMAHNLARHAGEKVSGGILMSIMARVVLLLDPTGILYSIFVPAAALLHDLPHSRDAEIEADHIGIHLAADACYDPRAAKRVFGAMKSDSENGGRHNTTPPEFISTHPSYDTRLSNFDDWMPKALAEFNADGGMRCSHVRAEMEKARRDAAEMALRREKIEFGSKERRSQDAYRGDESPWR